MTDRNPFSIAGIVNFAMTQDGKKYAFTVATKQGPAFDLEIEAEELGTLVQYLVTHAAAMGRKRLLDGFGRNELASELSPIPTEGIGMSGAATADTMLLVTRLYTFDLAFEIPSTSLAGLAENIRRSATLMDSDQTKRN